MDFFSAVIYVFRDKYILLYERKVCIMDTNTMLWQTQLERNNLCDEQIKMLIGQIGILMDIVQDHEKDMLKMCDKINELERQLSEIKRA